MIQKVLSFAEQFHMIENGDHILVGVSGGADSVCLLLMLHELCETYSFRLTAVHVEHGIRGADSLQDARFVQELCGRLGVACVVKHCDAPAYAREQGMSLEEGARALRYGCFEEVRLRLQADKIAVAHNKNDCGETLLFQMIRGSGLRGMCGIEPVRGSVIRPLLCLDRKEIEAFLEEKGQDFCMDSTNLETEYSRNKIRHQVLPVLREINAEVVEHLYRSTRYAAEAMELVEALTKDVRGRCVKRVMQESTSFCGRCADGVLLVEELLSMQPLVQRTLVLKVLEEQAKSRKDISEVHVLKVLELFEKQVGKRISLPYRLQAERTYEGVIIYSLCVQEPGEARSFVLEPGKTLEIPDHGLRITARILEKKEEFQEIPKKTYTKWFDYDKIKGTLLLRNRIQGDFFEIDAVGRKQSLKKYLINEKIPAQARDGLLVLAEGAHILWVIGGRISEAYKVTKDTERILEVQANGGELHE